MSVNYLDPRKFFPRLKNVRATLLTTPELGASVARLSRRQRMAVHAAKKEPAPVGMGSIVANSRPPPSGNGRLGNGNPPGDLRRAPRCGARTRAHAACRQPAMRNGRCRLHGGKSTGPRTQAGLERCRRAAWRHGGRSRAFAALRHEGVVRRRRIAALSAELLERLALERDGSPGRTCVTEKRTRITAETQRRRGKEKKRCFDFPPRLCVPVVGPPSRPGATPPAPLARSSFDPPAGRFYLAAIE